MVSVTTPTNPTPQPQAHTQPPAQTQALNIIEHCNNTNNKTPLTTPPVVSQDDHDSDIDDLLKEYEDFANDEFSFDDLPPGYRFCPTDVELIRFYLNKKVSNEPLPPNQIVETNLYGYNPEFLAANYKKCGENELYFFTPRDRKYLNGVRPNRATGDGYWKATGVDKPIIFDETLIGYKKALVFYQGKPPNGTKTDWIMHEFRVDTPPRDKRNPSDMRLDDSVLCRIYKKTDPKTKSNRKSTWINIKKGMELEEPLLDLFFDTFPFDTFPFDTFPPGYRFCPTDNELVRFYLNKKVSNEPLPPNQIVETNLYHHNPEFLAS
ncbi:NAC transcription factor NAM-1-like [Quercus lobata]|uniref:NAC transcription factor NAM-1-like n=1 Tax=Quercus lobata TaxID=97700 RepID=UPI001244CBF0|nr:NAC transcription factor NAM-1-like [Quercus lobata]